MASLLPAVGLLRLADLTPAMQHPHTQTPRHLQTYAIELTSMTQVNRLTKFRRSVRRWTVTSPSLPMAAAAPRPAVTSPAPAPEDLSPDRVEAAAAKKAVAQKRLNRSQVLEGPVILHIDGHRADLEKAQKRLRGEFKRLCLTEQRETPPGLRYLKKALQQQLKEEAVERDLQLELEKSPNGAWGMTCAGVSVRQTVREKHACCVPRPLAMWRFVQGVKRAPCDGVPILLVVPALLRCTQLGCVRLIAAACRCTRGRGGLHAHRVGAAACARAGAPGAGGALPHQLPRHLDSGGGRSRRRR